MLSVARLWLGAGNHSNHITTSCYRGPPRPGHQSVTAHCATLGLCWRPRQGRGQLLCRGHCCLTVCRVASAVTSLATCTNHPSTTESRDPSTPPEPRSAHCAAAGGGEGGGPPMAGQGPVFNLTTIIILLQIHGVKHGRDRATIARTCATLPG